MTHGYHGKILHVDLTKGKFDVEEPGEEFYKKYLGGSACPCGPYCEDLLTGRRGCCMSCQNRKGIGYNF